MMPNRFGYACINMSLGHKGSFRSMIKRTWLENGLPHASRLALENTKTTCRIIDWNNRNGIGVYRMTSDLFPWASEYDMEKLPDWSEIRANLELAGKLAKKGGQRLSFHPGQFNCLTSPTEKVIVNCIRDLEIHGQVMDVIGMPRTPEAKINIHLGGSFGDRKTSMERWCKNFPRLSEAVRSRLTIENDDKASLFSPIHIFEGVTRHTGVPIVFDSHHWTVGSRSADYHSELHVAASSWPKGIRPACHHSSSATIEGKKVKPCAHSDYIHSEFDSAGLDNLDIVIEAKAKELAVIQYNNNYCKNVAK
jgi:UV DNA damage endonuclease